MYTANKKKETKRKRKRKKQTKREKTERRRFNELSYALFLRSMSARHLAIPANLLSSFLVSQGHFQL
jgi:hypothetical protein